LLVYSAQPCATLVDLQKTYHIQGSQQFAPQRVTDGDKKRPECEKSLGDLDRDGRGEVLFKKGSSMEHGNAPSRYFSK
jgi:hypothetical protein